MNFKNKTEIADLEKISVTLGNFIEEIYNDLLKESNLSAMSESFNHSLSIKNQHSLNRKNFDNEVLKNVTLS